MKSKKLTSQIKKVERTITFDIDEKIDQEIKDLKKEIDSLKTKLAKERGKAFTCKEKIARIEDFYKKDLVRIAAEKFKDLLEDLNLCDRSYYE